MANKNKIRTKVKTRKAAAKRYKITSTGKVIRNQTGRRHILGDKPAQKMRQKKNGESVSKTDLHTIKHMLPYA